MGLNKGWNNIPKKILAAGLSLMMIGGSLDLSASVAAAQTTEPQAAVAARLKSIPTTGLTREMVIAI